MKAFMMGVFLVFASLALGVAADALSVSILSPTGGQVDQRHEVKGNVSDPNADVWVVIRPKVTSDFWVQPPVTVNNDGSWSVVVYFGEAGRHVGAQYEVRAFANPVGDISEGKQSRWPKAEARSNVVEVQRR